MHVILHYSYSALDGDGLVFIRQPPLWKYGNVITVSGLVTSTIVIM